MAATLSQTSLGATSPTGNGGGGGGGGRPHSLSLASVTSPEIEGLLAKLEKLAQRRDVLEERAEAAEAGETGAGGPPAAQAARRKMRGLQKKEAALRKKLRVERKRQRLRDGFRGAPSSYKHFSFSSAVNRRLKNHQDIAPYDPRKKNPFFAKQQRRAAELSDAGRAARAEKVRRRKQRMHEELEARWRGVPFTTRKLSFSSTANRHIRNEQEYTPVTDYKAAPPPPNQPKAHERWGLAPTREEDVEPPEFPGLLAHDTPWQGSPSSYQKLSFSSSANKHIQRKQAIPGSRVARTAPRPDEEPEWRRRERREKRWKLTGRGPPERVRREMGWQGSPSTADFKLTFSNSANKMLRSKQALPELKPLHPKPRRKKPTKAELARRKQRAEAKQQREQQFVGSPTSQRRLTFSKPANRFIRNHQDFSDYTDPRELEFRHENGRAALLDDADAFAGEQSLGSASDGEGGEGGGGGRGEADPRASGSRGSARGGGVTSASASRPSTSASLKAPEQRELEFYFKGAALTPRGTKEVSFALPPSRKAQPKAKSPTGAAPALAAQLDAECLRLSDEHVCFVLDWQTVREGSAVPRDAFVGGHGGFSTLFFARAEVSDAGNSSAGSIVVVGQAGCEVPDGGGGAYATLKSAHLPLGSMPFEAKTYHILMVHNQPELADKMETDLRWVPCRAGEPVPPGAISGDEQGSVYLARAAIFGKHLVGGRDAPQISFPGCVRAYLGEDGTTPCLHKANIPTNNNILSRQHFDVLCLQQFAREPDTFDGFNL